MKRLRLIGALACAAALLAALPASRRRACRSAPPAGCGATRCRRATRSARSRSRAPTATRSATSARCCARPTAARRGPACSSGTFTNLTEVQAIDADSLFAGGGCVARRSDDGGATFKRVAFTPVESRCQRAARGGLVRQPRHRLPRARPTAPSCAPTTTATPSPRRSPCPGTRAAGGGVDADRRRFLTDHDRLRRDHRRQDLPHGRRRELVDARSATPTRAVRKIIFVDAKQRLRGRRRLAASSTTDDGGATWTPQGVGMPRRSNLHVDPLRDADALRHDDRRQPARAHDGRRRRRRDARHALADPVYAAGFASATRVAAARRAAARPRSPTTRGATFAPIGGRLRGRYFAMRRRRRRASAFAPGDNGSLAKTVDGGKTWTRGNVATSEDVLDVSFPTGADGFALDIAGGLFRTDDGGATWRALDTGTTARPAAVLAPTTDDGAARRPARRAPLDRRRRDVQRRPRRRVNSAKLDAVDRAGSAIVA